MEVLVFEYKFNGMYEWGTGWLSSEYADRWHRFFDLMTLKPGYMPLLTEDSTEEWTYTPWRCLDEDGNPTLVNIGRAIYMHPMSGNGVFEIICDGDAGKAMAFHLKTLLENLCEYIGDGVTVDVTWKVKRFKYERMV